MSQENRKAKSKIPYFFFAFFAVIFVVNIFYIYISQQSWRGVVTEKSYQKGVEYNKTIALMKRQKESGFKAKINFESLGNSYGVLRVGVSNKSSSAIKNANIRVFLKRPTQDGFDFDVPLVFADGEYQARISFPLKGQWDFNLAVAMDEEVFYEVKRYVVQ